MQDQVLYSLFLATKKKKKILTPILFFDGNPKFCDFPSSAFSSLSDHACSKQDKFRGLISY